MFAGCKMPDAMSCGLAAGCPHCRPDPRDARIAELEAQLKQYIADGTDVIAALRANIAELESALTEAEKRVADERKVCARITEGGIYKEHYRTWSFWVGDYHKDNPITKHSDQIAAAIRARAEEKIK